MRLVANLIPYYDSTAMLTRKIVMYYDSRVVVLTIKVAYIRTLDS